jgi:UDP-glucose 4-epimerase
MFTAEGEVNKFLTIPGNHGTSLRLFNVVGAAVADLMDNSVVTFCRL